MEINGKIYIVGGKQKENAALLPEWYSLDEAVVYEIDWSNKYAKQVFSYKTPPEFLADEHSSITFKSSYYDKETKYMYLCTMTEVLIVTVPEFKVLHHISHPYFNDLHYVRPFGDNLLVVSTGLDLVIEVNYEGNVINCWSTIEKNTWERFDRNKDYRKVPTTKPHLSHPNYVSIYKDDIWITRFEQKDAVSLYNFDKRIPINIEKPHDGEIFFNHSFYTTVNGYVLIADPQTGQIKNEINLNNIQNPLKLNLGWCRGIYMISESIGFVGFTTIRETKYTDNLNWLEVTKSNIKRLNKKKTRIGLYNLKTQKLIDELNLENFGFNVLFSIIYVQD